jgi:ABC-type multidrug transport system fused ATPase/permease subunit
MDTFRRLLNDLRPYWKTLTVAVALTFLSAGIDLVPPLFYSWIVDTATGARAAGQLVALVAGLIVVQLASSGTRSADLYVRHALGERVIYNLRLRLYDHLQRLSLSFFESRQTGELMSRLTNDVRSLENLVTHNTEFLIVDTLRIVGVIVLLLVLDWRLALWTLLPVPILAVGLRWFNQRIRPIYRRIRKHLGSINAALEENLAGIRVIQAYAQEEQELSEVQRESHKYLTDRIGVIRQWSVFQPAAYFLTMAGTAMVLGVGASMVLRGQMSIGTVVAFLSYAGMFFGPVARLVEIDNEIQEAIAAGERLYELLDTPPEVKDQAGAVELDGSRGEVVFEGVSFAYRSGEEVLHDVSFRVAPGERVALVGPSGAGKTSIANLTARFYDPAAGRVTLDGRDLREITLKSLRRQAAIVLQDTFLFNGTVRENLLYGRLDAGEAAMLAAASAAYAHDFIMALPAGYDTEIGERGVRLSGGQKQRLALARAIITDPRIIILDEATSSVDAEAEYWIQRALNEVLRGRTAIIIAHRLSTIRNADKIVVLDDGRIVEVGPHAELLRAGGLYSQLYERQRQM